MKLKVSNRIKLNNYIELSIEIDLLKCRPQHQTLKRNVLFQKEKR